MPDDEYYDDTPDEGSSFAPTPHGKIDVNKMRESGTYKRLKARFRDDCSRQRNPGGGVGAPCELCQVEIDYRLPWPHPQSFSVDHIKTAKEAPSLFMDTANWQAAHLSCNESRGSDEMPIDLGVPSEIW